MPEVKRPLKVFLCYTHIDKVPVRQLYDRLVDDGVDVWMDKAKLFGGSNWEYEIRKAMRNCDIFVVYVSNQFTKQLNLKKFSQTEVGIALDEAALKPKDEIHIIPVRLEECFVPRSDISLHVNPSLPVEFFWGAGGGGRGAQSFEVMQSTEINQ